jgi:phosphate starvation-inducible PhoH-like protein
MHSETLHYSSSRHLDQLYASQVANLELVERHLEIQILTRDEWIRFTGPQDQVGRAVQFFEVLDAARSQGIQIRQSDFVHLMDASFKGGAVALRQVFQSADPIRLKRRTVVPKTVNQKHYLDALRRHELVFGVGPAGTGKTYLAMAHALSELLAGRVEKLILTRPAVEAGEALGFLPGDLEEKILPYLRPLYDAMHDLLGKEDAARVMERGAVEVAPLAYMRGRTLSNAFILLDEAQNTTPEQMMMFLTRMGDHSRMVVTGDLTQVDLPRSKKSGLKQALDVLQGVEGIKSFYLDESDVVRHPLVQKIIEAYQHHGAS